MSGQARPARAEDGDPDDRRHDERQESAPHGAIAHEDEDTRGEENGHERMDGVDARGRQRNGERKAHGQLLDPVSRRG